MMTIAIISGSHREDSQSGKVAHYLAKQLEAKGVNTFVRELGKEPLPLWDEGMWQGKGDAFEAWQPLKAELQKCDGLIVVAAEWNGSAPAALKNFFHYPSMAELGHKPGLIVGVSASINGAYPVAELHMSSVKNCKLVYVPDHLIVRNVGSILNEEVNPEEHNETDLYMRERIEYSLGVFLEYADALKKVRASGKTETDKFGFGQ